MKTTPKPISADMIRLLLLDGRMVGRQPLPVQDVLRLSEIDHGIQELRIMYAPSDAFESFGCAAALPLIWVSWDTRPYFHDLPIMPWEWEGSAYVPVPIARAALRSLVSVAGIGDYDFSDEAFNRFFGHFKWPCSAIWDERWIRSFDIRVEFTKGMSDLGWSFVDPLLAKHTRTAVRRSTVTIPTALIPYMFRGLAAGELAEGSEP